MGQAALKNSAVLRVMDGARHAFVDGRGRALPPETPQLVYNDARRGEKVLSVLEKELRGCKAFAFSVAFVTKSGITPLKQTLAELEAAGVPGRILTTDYLQFSEPAALEELAAFSNITVRMYRTEGVADAHGFHTKGYLFERADGVTHALVGSSNMTASALTKNKEWNMSFSSLEDGSVLADLQEEFEALWAVAQPLDAVLAAYREIFEEHRRMLAEQRRLQRELRAREGEPGAAVTPMRQVVLTPNSMQANFVERISALVQNEEERALLISATGTGKTYASAFALRHLAPKRVLFLAHREQILRQSISSYRDVLGQQLQCGLLSGNSRPAAPANPEQPFYIFSTMQTMCKEATLAQWAPDSFDLIVIDEVHRAGAGSYQRIMEHFAPKFWLGMTASPDRPDGFDIYGLFHNNIAYEIRLQNALEEGLLCPFHYFGVRDVEVDGLQVDENAAFGLLTCDERVERVLEQSRFYGWSGSRVKGLIFCSRNEEARALAAKMQARGVRAAALCGADSLDVREQCVKRLAAEPGSPHWHERLDYLLTVDIFNEGIDIPEVNQVIMLRPTESPIVFVQQLGRGLRRAGGKEFVVIIDFIGNYRNNFLIPIALSGDRSYNKDTIRKYVLDGARSIPGESTVHFDAVSRQRIFAAIDASSVGLRDFRAAYQVLRNKLGRLPRMCDFLRHGHLDPLLIVQRLRSYYLFLPEVEKSEKLLPTLNATEHSTLEFLQRYCANGMRLHELLLLRRVAVAGVCSEAQLAEELQAMGEELREADFLSAALVLDGTFVNVQRDRVAYAEAFPVELDRASREVLARPGFISALMNSDFVDALEDVIKFGLNRWQERYAGGTEGLRLYEKYTRKDACRLLNWGRDESSTIYGYKVKHGTCPIFVTYHKDEGISETTRYADQFVNRSEFSWMTRSRRTLASREVAEIVRAEANDLHVHLFVKKSDDEGADFYYLGRVRPTEWTETTQSAGDDVAPVPIVNIRLALDTPVQPALFDYLTAE